MELSRAINLMNEGRNKKIIKVFPSVMLSSLLFIVIGGVLIGIGFDVGIVPLAYGICFFGSAFVYLLAEKTWTPKPSFAPSLAAQPQGYPPTQPQGYPPVQSQGYPPVQSQGYPPTQPQGYPPAYSESQQPQTYPTKQ